MTQNPHTTGRRRSIAACWRTLLAGTLLLGVLRADPSGLLGGALVAICWLWLGVSILDCRNNTQD